MVARCGAGIKPASTFYRGVDKMANSQVVESFAPYLNVRNTIFGAFAADSATLLYLNDTSGTYQVWQTQNGATRQLTDYQDRLTGLHPAPGGRIFLFTKDTGGDENDQLYLLTPNSENATVETLLNDGAKNTFGAWRADGKAYCFTSNKRQPAFFDIYVHEQDANGQWQTPRMVYQADERLSVTDWSADGRWILAAKANTNVDQDLYLLDLQTPNAQPRHLTPHDGQAVYNEGTFSADAAYIYLITDQERDFSAPARLEIATGKLEYLANFGWDCGAIALSPDDSKLAYEINDDGCSRLFVRWLDGSTREIEVMGLPPGIALGIGLFDSPLRWSPDGRKLVFSFNSPVHNADLWVYDLESEILSQATQSDRAGLDFGRFTPPQTIKYPTFDGLQIPALLYLPEGAEADGRLPFIVYVHGGPEGQTRYGWNPIIAYYVARGYGVLAPNVRGSSGYGNAFMALDDIEKRPDSVADLAAAVEWLHESDWADGTKIGVQGQSYGGFMVLAALTTYPDLWAAGVDIYGIANMLTFLQNTSPYRIKLRTPEYGDPVANRDFLIEVSPIHKIDRITAPLMVVHGARDPRVPLSESEQMVEALRARQHPVEFLVFDDEGHSIAKLKNKLVAWPAIADFFDKYLRG
jgi:dipeptidyl aminopeptidase/acylaminoacyl peptidase